jgi:hypothetical protein
MMKASETIVRKIVEEITERGKIVQVVCPPLLFPVCIKMLINLYCIVQSACPLLPCRLLFKL